MIEVNHREEREEEGEEEVEENEEEEQYIPPVVRETGPVIGRVRAPKT